MQSRKKDGQPSKCFYRKASNRERCISTNANAPSRDALNGGGLLESNVIACDSQPLENRTSVYLLFIGVFSKALMYLVNRPISGCLQAFRTEIDIVLNGLTMELMKKKIKSQ